MGAFALLALLLLAAKGMSGDSKKTTKPKTVVSKDPPSTTDGGSDGSGASDTPSGGDDSSGDGSGGSTTPTKAPDGSDLIFPVDDGSEDTGDTITKLSTSSLSPLGSKSAFFDDPAKKSIYEAPTSIRSELEQWMTTPLYNDRKYLVNVVGKLVNLYEHPDLAKYTNIRTQIMSRIEQIKMLLESPSGGSFS